MNSIHCFKLNFINLKLKKIVYDAEGFLDLISFKYIFSEKYKKNKQIIIRYKGNYGGTHIATQVIMVKHRLS